MQAVDAHKAGKMREAEVLYRAILQTYPQHPDANHNLGVLAIAVGKPELALPYLKRALEAYPEHLQFWLSYIETLTRLGMQDEAQVAILAGKSHGVSEAIFRELDERFSSMEAATPATPADMRKDSIDAESEKKLSEDGDAKSALIRAFNSGKYAEAEILSRMLTQSQPEDALGWKALGASLRQSGKPADALLPMQKAVELGPEDAEAHCNLGTLLMDLGKWNDAVIQCRYAIDIDPEYATAYNSLAAALKAMGRLDEAEIAYRQAITIKPDYPEPYNNLGNVLHIQSRLEEAKKSLEKAIELKPGYAEAYCNLGVVLTDMCQLEEACKAFKNAIAIKPDYVEAIGSLGVALYDMGRYEEAESCCRRVISIKPHNAVAYNNLGNALSELGKNEEAESSYRRAISIESTYADANFNLGVSQCEHGKIKEGISSLETALRLNPQNAEFHRAISRYKKFTAGDPEIAVMQGIYADPKQSRSAHGRICFALAKAHEDMGSYDESFRLYAEGNRLCKAESGYDIAHDKELFEAIKKTFLNTNLKLNRESASKTDKQYIFIIGMPRSGTTLVEQILSSHSKVFGAGELDTLNNTIYETFNGSDGRFGFVLSEINIGKIRRGYETSLNRLATTRPVIVDKMPHNFRWVGFLLMAFPDCKIIHTVRDPIPVCWSIFKNYFPAKGLGFTWDLGDLAEYYKLYEDIMAFWHEKFPGRIYDLNYEKLTENQEEETRKLLEYCGLPWEDACLEFEKTERVVRTASTAQVRNGMYKGSNEAWKRFEPHLGILKEGLTVKD